MKKTITKLALALGLATTLTVHAQTVVTFDGPTYPLNAVPVILPYKLV